MFVLLVRWLEFLNHVAIEYFFEGLGMGDCGFGDVWSGGVVVSAGSGGDD